MFDREIVRRVVDFDRWCMAQPRGDNAGTDIMTIQVVAFYEKLFEHDDLLPLIRHVMTRADLMRNIHYYVTWVGADRYEAALRVAFGDEQPRQPHARRRKARRPSR